MKKKIKHILINTLKFSLAVGLIAYLVQSGQLNFAILQESFSRPFNWLICILLLLVNVATTTIRWQILLRIKTDSPLPFLSLLRLTWIGLLFSTILPGAVTGDLIKIAYAKNIDPKLPLSYIATSTFIDRFIGLLGLLLILGVASTIHYQSLTSMNVAITKLVHLNFLIFAVMILLLSSLFMPKKIQNILLQLFAQIPVLGTPICKILRQIWLMGEKPRALSLCISLSVFGQFLNVFALWLITYPFAQGSAFELQHAYTFAPLGFVTQAIPISPAGIGVGHLAFAKLFSFYHITNGADLFNIFFVSWFLVNILGIIPYMFGNRKISLEEAKHLSDNEETCLT